jgi:hypothetical protein
MTVTPGSLFSAIADRFSPPGRRARRRWVRHGRAHIEVKGVHRPENAVLARRVEEELARPEGADWAAVNAVLGRVIVAFDDRRLGVDDLVEVIEGVEEAYGIASERFPHDRPEHPADTEAMHRQIYAIGADLAGLGLGLDGRVIRTNPLLAEAASLVSLVDATPALRRQLESRLGHAAADLGLAVGNAIAQGLALGPLGLLVDIAHRGLRFDETRARQNVWGRREPELQEQREGAPPRALSAARRPVPLPPGPVESYADRAAQAALAGAAAAGVVTRDVRTMVAATVTATPKAAQLGREGFAAQLGRDLAHSGVLAMVAPGQVGTCTAGRGPGRCRCVGQASRGARRRRRRDRLADRIAAAMGCTPAHRHRSWRRLPDAAGDSGGTSGKPAFRHAGRLRVRRRRADGAGRPAQRILGACAAGNQWRGDRVAGERSLVSQDAGSAPPSGTRRHYRLARPRPWVLCSPSSAAHRKDWTKRGPGDAGPGRRPGTSLQNRMCSASRWRSWAAEPSPGATL